MLSANEAHKSDTLTTSHHMCNNNAIYITLPTGFFVVFVVAIFVTAQIAHLYYIQFPPALFCSTQNVRNNR